MTRKCSYRPRNPEKFKVTQKWLKSDFWGSGQSDSKVTKKWLKSNQKVTFLTVLVTFESLLSNFWVTLAGAPKVTFESLFRVFEFFGVSGSVGALPGHKFTSYLKDFITFLDVILQIHWYCFKLITPPGSFPWWAGAGQTHVCVENIGGHPRGLSLSLVGLVAQKESLSRIAWFPESQPWNCQKSRNEKRKHESNRSQVPSWPTWLQNNFLKQLVW